ncbi:FAD/NAD(P)-binding domain-containing protein [Crassisporium funariophilum]|nr:FAD/NAD(P)-binding domain-containing protein [Crassisporium funariophilum]
MSKKNDDRKNIVVVGGGGGGARTARLLSTTLDASKYNLILVDARPHFIILPAAARLNVTDADGLEDKALVPLTDIFYENKGTFVQGRATGIEKSSEGSGGHVVLADGERVEYHILVLAPGSVWSGVFGFPDSKEDLLEFLKKGRAALDKAQDIVLVGGGAVGVEFAGEIKCQWPDKKITIVQGDDGLLNKVYPNKFRKALESKVRALGIDVILNDFVDDLTTPAEITTRSGKTIKADLVLSTSGPKPNTEFIAKSLGADVLTERGLVKINPTLQMVAHPDIFVVGDVVDYREQKMLMKAQNHAGIVAANVVAQLNGGALKAYKGTTEMIVITLGRNGGAGFMNILWGIVLGDWFARLAKSKTLLIGQLRATVGL